MLMTSMMRRTQRVTSDACPHSKTDETCRIRQDVMDVLLDRAGRCISRTVILQFPLPMVSLRSLCTLAIAFVQVSAGRTVL